MSFVPLALRAERAPGAPDDAIGLVLESTIDLAGRPIGRPVAVAAGPLGGLYLADAARGTTIVKVFGTYRPPLSSVIEFSRHEVAAFYEESRGSANVSS